MIVLDAMTDEELIRYLRTQGGLTPIEQTLLERLIATLDEVDALSAELAG